MKAKSGTKRTIAPHDGEKRKKPRETSDVNSQASFDNSFDEPESKGEASATAETSTNELVPERLEENRQLELEGALRRALCLDQTKRIGLMELLYRRSACHRMPERIRVPIVDPSSDDQSVVELAQDGRRFGTPWNIHGPSLWTVLTLIWGEELWMSALNKTYAMVTDGDPQPILKEGKGSHGHFEVLRINKASFCDALKGWYVYGPRLPQIPKSTKAKDDPSDKGEEPEETKPAADKNPLVRHEAALYWLRSLLRRIYPKVHYAPFPPPEGHYARNLSSTSSASGTSSSSSDQAYNIYRGLAIDAEYCEDPAPLVRKHLLEVICSGDKQTYDFLLRWLAHLIQKPQEKTEVVLVLQSVQGTGKSIIAKLLLKLLGNHAIQMTHDRHVLNHFNDHLRYMNLIIFNEASWAGDKQAEGLLKSAITDYETIFQSRNGKPQTGINYWNCIFLSNNESCIPITLDNRRFFLLPVSDCRVRDTEYFSELTDAIDHRGEDRQFLGFLLNFPLPPNWRASSHVGPNRQLILQFLQKDENADLRWIVESLSQGTWESTFPRSVTVGSTNRTVDFPVVVARPGQRTVVVKEDFLELYRNDQSKDGDLKRHGRIASVSAATRVLKKFFSDPELFDEEYRASRNEPRSYSFGPIELLRRHVAKEVLKMEDFFDSTPTPTMTKPSTSDPGPCQSIVPAAKTTEDEPELDPLPPIVLLPGNRRQLQDPQLRLNRQRMTSSLKGLKEQQQIMRYADQAGHTIRQTDYDQVASEEALLNQSLDEDGDENSDDDIRDNDVVDSAATACDSNSDSDNDNDDTDANDNDADDNNNDEGEDEDEDEDE